MIPPSVPSGLAALAALAAPISVEAVPFPGLSEGRPVGCAVLRGGLTLRSEADGFGGYSGLSVAGERAVLVSDAGHRLVLALGIDADGLIADVRGADLTVLRDGEGAVLGKRDGDAEGIAAAGGGHVVTIEGEDRLALLDGDRLAPAYPAPAGDEPILGRNSGYEAVAALPDGTLMVLSEGLDADGHAVVRRGRLGAPLTAWAEARYAPADGFNVTAARIDPASGDLFVLERAYSLWRGPRMRIARVAADRLDEPVLWGATVTRMGWREGIDNMEGLDLARAADGTLRLYLVSDDNYSGAQRTVLLSLALAPGCEAG